MKNDTMKNAPTKSEIIGTLHAWVSQRPGLDFADYGDATAYRAEIRRVGRQLNDARALLRAVEWRESITAADLLAAMDDQYRLAWAPAEGKRPAGLRYCTGQYWPTEYRAAACSALARVLWARWRADLPKGTDNAGAALRRVAVREFGRGLAGRWFN